MIKILFINIILIVVLFLNNNVHALCVNSPEVNLRSGPGTNYERTWTTFKYMPLQEISAKEDWYKVKNVYGDVHWIYTKAVTDKIKCAAVKINIANIRSGPGKEYRTIYTSPAMKYESFKVLKINKSWVNVVDSLGNKGWIFKNLLWIQ